MTTLSDLVQPAKPMETGRGFWRTSLAIASRLRLTLGYLVVSATAMVYVSTLHPHAQMHLLFLNSTNLRNLGHGHLLTLGTSVFLTDGTPNWIWWVGISSLFGAAEWLSGSLRFLGTVALGQIGATMIVAVGLLVGIHFDLLSHKVSFAIDVGSSYAAAAVAGSLVRYLPGLWKYAWASGWIVAVAYSLITEPSFTAAGHATALTLGILAGALYLRRDRRRVVRAAIAVVAGSRVHSPGDLVRVS